MALSPKQASFVAQYLIDKNGTQAAIRAGYSPKTANEQAARLLAQVSIRQEIDMGLQAQVDEAGITAMRVIKELATLGTIDLRSYYDVSGNLKPMHELTPEQGAAMAGVESLKRNVEAGDGVMDTVYKVKLWDKPRALELLAKHFGLLTERVEHGGKIEISWKKS